MDDLTGPPSQTWTPWACGSNGLHHATTESFGKDLNLFWGVFFVQTWIFFANNRSSCFWKHSTYKYIYCIYIYIHIQVLIHVDAKCQRHLVSFYLLLAAGKDSFYLSEVEWSWLESVATLRWSPMCISGVSCCSPMGDWAKALIHHWFWHTP